MKKIGKITVLLLILIIALSCATVTVPVSATSNDLGRLVGTSTGRVWFGLFGNADASIMESCRNGGIREISSVDFETKLIWLGLGRQYTCIVTGNKKGTKYRP